VFVHNVHIVHIVHIVHRSSGPRNIQQTFAGLAHFPQ
jgi:hypothetical protein